MPCASHQRISRQRQNSLSARIVIVIFGQAARSRRTNSFSTARVCRLASRVLGRR